MTRTILFGTLFILTICLACNSDAGSSKTANKTEEATAKTPDDVNNHNHDHAHGHDHSHGHEGHNHAAFNTATKSTIPAEKMDGPMPDPCELISADYVSEIIGVIKENITLKEGSKPDPNGTMRACFYKWDDPSWPNSGLLVQVMKNPVPEETDEWAFYYIDSKKSMGETSMNDPDNPIKYIPYNDLGDAGAASPELKKFYWRISNKLVFSVAYNMAISEQEQYDWTKKIGQRVMENYAKL